MSTAHGSGAPARPGVPCAAGGAQGGWMSSETTQILIIAVASGPAVFLFVHALEWLTGWLDRRSPD